jgi:phenylacetate-CoA ligase
MLTSRWYRKIREWDTYRLLRHLRISQYWPTEKIRQYQWERISKLLQHAYAHVPYYRRIFQTSGVTPLDFKSFDDFQQLPVLSKTDIRENFDDLVARNVPPSELIPDATGGSTGEPLHYYHDRQYQQWADAAIMRGWYEFAGCSPGDCCAVLWGAERDVSSDFSTWERFKDLCRYGEIRLNSFNLSDDRKKAFLRWCRWFRPRLLRGYVTAIKELAVYLDENRLLFPKLDGVILCAETVDDDSQAYIERVFRAISYNTYGSREVSLIAMECSMKNGLHEVSENNYVEFEPIDLPGYTSAGNLLITNLNNYVMPFIRYRIGDIGVCSTQETCLCKRGLPLIAHVIGRTTDIFQFYDGTRIAGEMFIHLMKDFPVRKYQFVQVTDRRVVLRLNQSDANNVELLEHIRNTYQPYLPAGVALDCEAVESFETTPTGKFHFVFRQFANAPPTGGV